VVDFSTPTFPSGVWLIARADAALSPISESGSHQGDIDQVRERLHQTSVLAMKGTCLDPDLYRLQDTRAEVRLYTRSTNLNEMVPAILRRDAETTLLDVPDALIALEKWPGEVKVIGPVSPRQEMGVAFPKTSPKLREAFNALFAGLWADGTYARMVRRYYPSVFHYYPDFFRTP
jgi:ABC-type amino acid transport substrate-binding protein